LVEGQTAQIESPGNKGLHKITVLKITDAAVSTNQFQKPTAGKKYWVVEVLIENGGQAELYLGRWKLRTNDDFEHDRTSADGLGETLSSSQNLTPGAKTQGVVIFKVDEGALPRFLRYDPNTFAKGDLYFDAESPAR